ncbi:MAG: hypothetical protein R2795_22940 [Saprospiraceae bacterium]
MRQDILSFQRDFYTSARKEAQAESRYGYVFGDDGDKSRTRHLLDILLEHQVEVYPLTSDVKANGTTFKAGQSYAVPLRQNQYRFVKGIFDPIKEFKDNIFTTSYMDAAYGVQLTLCYAEQCAFCKASVTILARCGS